MAHLTNVAAVADLAGVSRVAVWKAIQTGRLKGRQVHGPAGEPSGRVVMEKEAERWARARLTGKTLLVFRDESGLPVASYSMPTATRPHRLDRAGARAVDVAEQRVGVAASDLRAALPEGTVSAVVAAVLGEAFTAIRKKPGRRDLANRLAALLHELEPNKRRRKA